MNNWLVFAAAIVGAIVGAGGAGPIILALAKRQTISAEAQVTLSDEARQWVEQFQEEAREARREAADARRESGEARKEAADARREAAGAHDEMTNVRREAQWLARELQRLHAAIRDPYATIDILRSMIGPDGGNGSKPHKDPAKT